MSLGEFLADRLPTVVLTLLAAAFGFALLVTLGEGAYAGGYLAGAILLAQAQAFVRAFQDRPGYHPWPEDLFHPAPGKRREQRTIPLVNGERGHVTVDIIARTAGAGGLLASFTRTVTSDLDGDMRNRRRTALRDRIRSDRRFENHNLLPNR